MNCKPIVCQRSKSIKNVCTKLDLLVEHLFCEESGQFGASLKKKKKIIQLVISVK